MMSQFPSQEQDPDIAIQEESLWNWPVATPGQRATAYVLDLLIIVATFQLLNVIAGRFAGYNLPSSLEGLLWIVYYVFSHSKSGQSLGKKAVGIRVVALDPTLSDEPLSLRSVLLRETVGRFVSVLIFAYGYIRIAINADRRGFHDVIAGTRVISLSQSASKPIQFRYILGGGAAFAAVLFLGYGYTLMYTPYPLKEYAKTLELKGYKIDGIHGSLVKGFVIDHVAFSNENYELEIDGASVNYDWRLSDEQTSFFVNLLTANTARLNIKRYAAASAPDEGPFGNQKLTPSSKVRFPEIRIKAIDVSHFELLLPERPVYLFDRISVTDLQAKGKDGSVVLGQVRVDSHLLKLDAGEVSFQGNKISLLRPLILRVEPGMLPDLLKAPADFEIEGKFVNFKPVSMKATGFSKRVNLKINGDDAEINISQFTPFHYLKTDLPIWDVNLKLLGNMKTQKLTELSGSAGLRYIRFDLNTANLSFMRGEKIYSMTPRLAAEWKAMLAGRDPGITLASSDHEFAHDILADLYYSRPNAKLSVSERETVARDAKFFADSLDAGIKKPAPASLRLAKNKADGRQPTSLKSARATPKGVPLKLPAYRKKARQ